MTARAVISITTYLDISAPQLGRNVYEAFASTAEEITPNRVNIWSQSHAIENGDDFGRLWLTIAPFERWDKRTKETLEKGTFEIGAEWRRVGGLAGKGEVHFRGEDNSRPDTLIVDHRYSPKVQWRDLFERLTELTRPAYGMLHVFTDAEIERSRGVERFDRFDGPFGGEEHFTSWRSSLGDWRRPDRWDLSERKRYRFLPELSWANFLGPEFQGEFDPRVVRMQAARSKSSEHGTLFEVSDELDDVINKPNEFEQRRMLLRSAFRLGFFRTPRIRAV